MMIARLTEHPILNVRKGELVEFSFDGKKMQGQAGEMLSTALIANGVKVFSRHRSGDAPQGIFCANGQCAQCTVIVNGLPVKSCITPLEKGMVVETLNHLPKLPHAAPDLPAHPPRELTCDVLVVGAGPSGIRASVELGQLGFSVIVVDDKAEPGGKLVLQTHKFFGSVEDCFAGTRGHVIGQILGEEMRQTPGVKVIPNSTVAALYSDGKAAVFEENRRYTHVNFRGLIAATGARERSLVFPGNDLPGVYGAGAFQTLVNRDLVKAAGRVLVVGCGNVGLIAAYHALQAGITVVGLVDIAPEVTGYKVHGDKIRRMGVPIYLRHTVLCVEGDDMVERATIAPVDSDGRPLLEEAKTFAVDTVLIAVGLASVDEYFADAQEFGFPVVKTGDADEIAEASSAMLGGRIAGRKMARLLGKDTPVPEEWREKMEILKSRPGRVMEREKPILSRETFRPVFHCMQEIPCDPCTTVCQFDSIKLKGETGTIMDLPEFDGKCIACGLCAAICPGLAITLARLSPNPGMAEVVLPHEFSTAYEAGSQIPICDLDGNVLGQGTVLKQRYFRKYGTHLITVEVPEEWAHLAAGIRVQPEGDVQPLSEAEFQYFPEDGIVCRCERVTVKEILDFARENPIHDLNQLKAIRVSMGACGGKTCNVLVPRILGQAGVDPSSLAPATRRPVTVEIPMWAIGNQEQDGEA
ncbi:MAG TPA: FAD-dependent oxidoreductase [Firmicutes bacterium]|nr:FAD-dependent oxidoreductase [Bacillota bacterium]